MYMYVHIHTHTYNRQTDRQRERERQSLTYTYKLSYACTGRRIVHTCVSVNTHRLIDIEQTKKQIYQQTRKKSLPNAQAP